MNNVLLVHGSHIRDCGETTIDKLKPHLSMFDILEADYGMLSVFGSLIFNDNVAELIRGMTPNNTIGIGHSNGCNILVEACNKGARIKTLILINPALSSTTIFPKQIKNIYVFHNKYDYRGSTAKLFSKSWGDMCRIGYYGDDKRVTNYETFALFYAKGHTDIFNKSESLVEFMERNDILPDSNNE
jgi:hypothetical protein